MNSVDAAFARVRELTREVDASRPTTDFAAVLEEQLPTDDVAGGAASTALGSIAPVSAAPTAAPLTLGAMIGLSPVAPAQPQAPTYAGGLLTHSELDRYLDELGVRDRNGHLDDADLRVVAGGWNDGEVRLLGPAAVGWQVMREAAAADGIDLRAIDSYRDWDVQARAHRDHIEGRKKANVLPPGHSEHGVGLAVDITNGSIIGRDDPEWHWLTDNAARFGWHPISNETWHWEFRGVG